MIHRNYNHKPDRAQAPGLGNGFYLLGLIAICCSETLSFAAPATVHLNEMMASNVGPGGLLDEDGQQVDWIEIANGSSTAVNLAGWSLTDNPAEPDKWSFPAVTIAPAQY